MRAGELDRLITIEQVTESRDAVGGTVLTWSTLAQVRAKVKPIAGREYYSADRINAQIDALFTIYFRSDVTEKMRISYDSKYWDIQRITEIGRRRGLEISSRVIAQ